MCIVSGPFGHMTITGAWVLDGSGPGDTGVLCVGTRMELTDTRGLPTTMSPSSYYVQQLVRDTVAADWTQG